MKKLLITLLSFMVAVMFVFTGCAQKSNKTPAVEQPGTEIEEDSGEDENEEDQTPLVSTFYGKQGKDDLTFDYSAAKRDALIAVYDKIKKACEDQELTLEEFESLLEDMDEKECELSDQQLLSEINYYSNKKSDENYQTYLKMEEMYNKVFNARKTVYEPVYLSKYKEVFYEDMSDEDIEAFIASHRPSDEAEALSNEIDEIKAEYGKLDYPENKDNFASYYPKFVDNQTKLSKLKGYDNFIDDCYDNTYHRDFTIDEVGDFATILGDKFLPTVRNANTYLKTLSADEKTAIKNMEKVLNLSFDSDQAQSILNDFYSYIGGDIYDAFNHLMQDGYYYFANGTGSESAAFTTYLYGKEEPVMFLSKASRGYYCSLITFVHEFGHYCNFYLSDGFEMLSFELAETQSQGAEWLFLSWYASNAQEDEETVKTYAKYKFFEDSYSVYVGTMIGLFEYEVYTQAANGQIGTTTKDFDNIFNGVIKDKNCSDFAGIYAGSIFSFYNASIYYKLVVINSPGYYISYAVSQISAYTLYAYSKADLRAAVDVYSQLVTRSEGYLGVLEDLDIHTPFESDTFDFIAAAYFN